MALNLPDTIQKNLNYPPLQKIDPNTQEVKVDNTTPDEHRFSQASIPAILTGLYKYSTTDVGAENILRGDISTDWVKTIFGDTKNEVVQKVVDYSYVPENNALPRMNKVAGEAVRLIREHVNQGGTIRDVKDFMSAQTNNILVYLPEALRMGELLKDTTLDDNTNKMEGPISSLMHKIGAAFSNPEDDEKINTKL